ncbi:hypothetical protein [Rhizobium leguminosarum]|jgi:hypothetical protein|uniref:hypothetical protein n=1 Tax=Rhizobium leguminosarum TaxID=384 RepID=UPI003519B004
MTDYMMNLHAARGDNARCDLLCEMISFAAERQMELEVDADREEPAPNSSTTAPT